MRIDRLGYFMSVLIRVSIYIELYANISMTEFFRTLSFIVYLVMQRVKERQMKSIYEVGLQFISTAMKNELN